MIEGGEDPVHCPAARHKCCRGHRPCKSQRPAACQCRFRRRDEDRMARRAHPRFAEAAVYLATSPKSNSAYLGIDAALGLVRQTGNQPVPRIFAMHPRLLWRSLAITTVTKYSHDYPGHFTAQQYMPDGMEGSASGMRSIRRWRKSSISRCCAAGGDRFKD